MLMFQRYASHVIKDDLSLLKYRLLAINYLRPALIGLGDQRGRKAYSSEAPLLAHYGHTWPPTFRPRRSVVILRYGNEPIGRRCASPRAGEVWDRPCRSRPADRSLVAEDRSARGVRDRDGTGTGAALGPHTTWTTRTTTVTGGQRNVRSARVPAGSSTPTKLASTTRSVPSCRPAFAACQPCGGHRGSLMLTSSHASGTSAESTRIA
jgi:hypothetical protein